MYLFVVHLFTYFPELFNLVFVYSFIRLLPILVKARCQDRSQYWAPPQQLPMAWPAPLTAPLSSCAIYTHCWKHSSEHIQVCSLLQCCPSFYSTPSFFPQSLPIILRALLRCSVLCFIPFHRTPSFSTPLFSSVNNSIFDAHLYTWHLLHFYLLLSMLITQFFFSWLLISSILISSFLLPQLWHYFYWIRWIHRMGSGRDDDDDKHSHEECQHRNRRGKILYSMRLYSITWHFMTQETRMRIKIKSCCVMNYIHMYTTSSCNTSIFHCIIASPLGLERHGHEGQGPRNSISATPPRRNSAGK